jgi:hypothetical protein
MEAILYFDNVAYARGRSESRNNSLVAWDRLREPKDKGLSGGQGLSVPHRAVQCGLQLTETSVPCSG